jgi:hypothetical protein
MRTLDSFPVTRRTIGLFTADCLQNHIVSSTRASYLPQLVTSFLAHTGSIHINSILTNGQSHCCRTRCQLSLLLPSSRASLVSNLPLPCHYVNREVRENVGIVVIFLYTAAVVAEHSVPTHPVQPEQRISLVNPGIIAPPLQPLPCRLTECRPAAREPARRAARRNPSLCGPRCGREWSCGCEVRSHWAFLSRSTCGQHRRITS